MCELNKLKPDIQKEIVKLYKSYGIKVLGKAIFIFENKAFTLYSEDEDISDYIPQFEYDDFNFNRKNITDFLQD